MSLGEVTFRTAGPTPSTVMLFEPPSEAGEPISGRVRLAMRPALALTAPTIMPVPDRASVPV